MVPVRSGGATDCSHTALKGRDITRLMLLLLPWCQLDQVEPKTVDIQCSKVVTLLVLCCSYCHGAS